MHSFTRDRCTSFEEKFPADYSHSWDEKADADDLDETWKSRTSTAYNCSPESSESDEETPPPPPDDLDGSVYTEGSFHDSIDEEELRLDIESESRQRNAYANGYECNRHTRLLDYTTAEDTPSSDNNDETSLSKSSANNSKGGLKKLLDSDDKKYGHNEDSFKVGTRRYKGDCGYDDFVAREDEKSDVSSEARLENIRFDYSNISTDSFQHCTSVAKSEIIVANRLDHQDKRPTDLSLPYDRSQSSMLSSEGNKAVDTKIPDYRCQPAIGDFDANGTSLHESNCVSREDGKSDASSDMRLDNLRFDYSNISSDSSQTNPYVGTFRIDTTHIDYPNIAHTHSSSQCKRTANQTDVHTIISHHSCQHTIEDIHMSGTTLQCCFLTLKLFALRCAFDHLRRGANYEEATHCSLKSSLSVHKPAGISPYTLRCNAIGTIEFMVSRSVKRTALFKLVSMVVWITLESHSDA